MAHHNTRITTMKVRALDTKRLAVWKTHPRQANWEVLKQILDDLEKKQSNTPTKRRRSY